MFCLATTLELMQPELYRNTAHSSGVQGRAWQQPAAKRGKNVPLETQVDLVT